MLGALEAKAVSRIARQCGAEWKPVHSAVLGCLLAYRSRRGGISWPPRQVIAEFVHASERTVDRAISRLVAWGAIERQRPRATSTQRFGTAQYTFLFELPQIEEKPCEKIEENSRAMRQNATEPCDKIEAPIRKEALSTKASIKSKGPPPKYSQQDFDERDWRQLNREINRLREAAAGTGLGGAGEECFKIACQRAGLGLRRGYELWERMTV
jgi:hypothetical protein